MNGSPLGAFLLVPFVLACFALAPQAGAVCQEGCLTDNNTALGEDALLNNRNGQNTAVGAFALLNNSGTGNTAVGVNPLMNNFLGSYNTAIGFHAILNNSDGSYNTAIGFEALSNNTSGDANTANGVDALRDNTTGNFNTATGTNALLSNATGNDNTANGYAALWNNTTGNFNTATGFGALNNNRTGRYNVALGFRAGFNLTTGDRNIDIGNAGMAGESNTIRIGRAADQTATFIAGISGATVPTGVAVIVDADGHLGTTTSSMRFKDAIKPMDQTSEAILALKPVTFRYKREFDPDGIRQFGLVAEEVEKVDPDLVARDAEGKPYSVRYEAVNAMLLNEFLKEHRKVQELEASDAERQREIKALMAMVKEQAAQIQKVNAHLAAEKALRRLVASE